LRQAQQQTVPGKTLTDHIFISYSKKDSEFAHKLADDLTAAGFKIWIDRSISGGEQWRETIETNLKAASEVVIVVSPNSMDSEWVKHEGSAAYAWEKKLYPILIAPVDSLPPWLEEYQWIDFVDTSHETAFNTLVAALTPPNPIQELLDQELHAYRETGDLIGEAILRVIEDARETLTIDDESKRLISKSKRVIKTRLTREREAQLELDLARRQRERIFSGVGIASTVLLILITIVLNSVGPSQTDQAPDGIVSLEFAGDIHTFETLLLSWEQSDYFRVGLSLGLDFLFIVVYSTAFSLGCFWAARKYKELNRIRLSRIGTFLAYTMWFAGVLDILENSAIIATIFNAHLIYGPQIALWAASGKFFSISLGLVYILTAVAILFLQRTKKRVKPGH